MNTTYHRFSVFQGAFSYQHCGDRTPAGINFGFDHMTDGRLIGIGLEFQNLSLERYHFKQSIDSLFFLGGYVQENRVTAPIFRS